MHDPTGCAFGAAIGLVELGHEVVFAGPPEWRSPSAGEMSRLLCALADRMFGAGCRDVDAAACDLVVVADVFGDFLAGLAPYLERGRTGALPPEWVLLYPDRLHRAIELSTSGSAPVVIDYSDAREHRESVFETIAGATLLARECGRDDTGPWRPFPYLFHGGVLWMQRMRQRHDWWIPPARRRRVLDWTFCGTVDHPRYAGRRVTAIAEVRDRWPGLRGDVCERASFAGVVGRLQAARTCLDLPGAGELCFRLHEALTLGVPVWKPVPYRVHVPPGLEDVLGPDPYALRGLEPHAVSAIADACCSPRAAAAALLAAAGHRIGCQGRMQMT